MEHKSKIMIGSKGIDLRKVNFEVPAWLINKNKDLIKNPNNHLVYSKKNKNSSSKNQRIGISENFLNIGNSNNLEIEKLKDSINYTNMEEERKELSNMFNQLAKHTNDSSSHGKISKNSLSTGVINNINYENINNSRCSSFNSDLSINDSVVEASGLKSHIGKKRKQDNSDLEKYDCNSFEPIGLKTSNNLSPLISINNNLNYKLINHEEINKNIDGLLQFNPVNNINKQPFYNFMNSNNHPIKGNQVGNISSLDKNIINQHSNTMSNLENIAHILQKLNNLTSNNHNNLNMKSANFVRSPLNNKYPIATIDPTTAGFLLNSNSNYNKNGPILNPVGQNAETFNYNHLFQHHHTVYSQTPSLIGKGPNNYREDLNNQIKEPLRDNFNQITKNNTVDGYNYTNINSHDNMLETLSDDEEGQKRKKSNKYWDENLNRISKLIEAKQIIPNTYIAHKPKVEEIFNKNISYMNKGEIKELNKIVGDGKNLRKIFKQEKMKLLSLTSLAVDSQNSKKEESEISSIKVNEEMEEGEVFMQNASNIFAAFNEKEPILSEKEIYQNSSSNQSEIIKEQNLPFKKVETLSKVNQKPKEIFAEGYSDILRREMEDKVQCSKIEETKISLVNQSANNSKLNNLLISRKSKVFFKLFNKGKELFAEFNIIFKSVEKSVMKIDYFLDVDEFLNLKMNKDDYYICCKLEISNPNFGDEDTKSFLEKMGDNKLGLVEDSEELYCVIFSKNSTIIVNLDLTKEISNREDLILIFKVSNESIKEKIKVAIKDMFTNKNRTNLLSSDFTSLSRESNKENINLQNEEIFIRENKLKELVKEIEELREFKFKNKEITEELLKKKESETKYKYKLYYDKILENEIQKILFLQKEKESLHIENSKFHTDLMESKKKIDTLEIKIYKYQNEISMQREKIISLEKEKEEALKNEKISMNSYLEAIRNIENLKSRLVETESKLSEAEKLQKKFKSSQDSSLVKIDEFLIEEVPCHTTAGTDINEKIFELQTKIESFLCIICLNKTRDCLFIDCNHLSCCFNCIKEKIDKLNGKNKKKKVKAEENIIKGQLQCPICKKENYTFQKIMVS